MKRAVSVSLGSSSRDKKVIVDFQGEKVSIERIGTDGDVEKAKRLFRELDSQVDAFGIGGVDLYLRVDDRRYPLRAAFQLIEGVKETPVLDGRGLKHTLERRVFELAGPVLEEILGEIPRFQQAFIPVTVDRIGLAEAVAERSEHVVFGDLMIGMGVPIPIHGLCNYKRVTRALFPILSYFPLSMLFYGSGGSEKKAKYHKYWRDSDLLAGDFMFMRLHLGEDLTGKMVITNTTTDENIQLLRERGVRLVVTTTPRYEGRSFGTNMMEAALTALAGEGQRLSYDQLNKLINELGLVPHVEVLNP
jgi:hypothetical protein